MCVSSFPPSDSLRWLLSTLRREGGGNQYCHMALLTSFFLKTLPPTRVGSPRSPRATSPSGASPPSPGPPRTGPSASSPRGTPMPLLQPPAPAWTADPGPGMLRGGGRVRSKGSQEQIGLKEEVVRLEVRRTAVLL